MCRSTMAPSKLDFQTLFTPDRLQKLQVQWAFEERLSMWTKYCSNPTLAWFCNKERCSRAGNKDNVRVPLFYYHFGVARMSTLRQEAMSFLQGMFINEDEAQHITEAFNLPGAMLQVVYAILTKEPEGPHHRVVVGACLFNALPELVFVSYVGRYDGEFSNATFMRKGKPGDPKRFDGIGLERIFFHAAQLFGSLLHYRIAKGELVEKLLIRKEEPKEGPKQITVLEETTTEEEAMQQIPDACPLWLQVWRRAESLHAHKRTGLRPKPLSDLPPNVLPSGEGWGTLPIILNHKSQPMLDRMVALCIEGA